MNNYLRLIFSTFVLFGFFACSSGGRTRPQQIPYFDHQVMHQGETLGLIARWYTGRTDNWRMILDHNPQVNAYRIRPGDIIKIPETLVTRTDQLPQSFITKAYKEKMPDSSQQAGGAAGPSASGSLSDSQGSNGSGVTPKSMQDLGPPETTLPEAGLTVSPDAPQPSAEKDSSRDELLNELLTE